MEICMMKNNKKAIRIVAIVCAVAMVGSVIVSMLSGLLAWQ